MKLLSLASLAIILASCASSQSANSVMPAPTEADAQRMQVQFSDVTLAKLQFGLESYHEDCMKCHGLKDPKHMSVDHINMIVPAMAKKANDVAKQTLVTADEEDAILKYMLAIQSRIN